MNIFLSISTLNLIIFILPLLNVHSFKYYQTPVRCQVWCVDTKMNQTLSLMTCEMEVSGM